MNDPMAPAAFGLPEVLAANPGLVVMLALLAVGTLVFGLLAWLMRGSGASLRAIAFVAGFFAIVVLPQAVGHLALAVQPKARETVSVAPPATLLRVALPDGGRSEDWAPIYARRMPGLQDAPATVWPTGQSLAHLRFVSAAQASEALLTYLSMHSVAPTLDRGGNEVRGSRGLGGGVVHLLREGNSLRIAAAPDDGALDALLQALGSPMTAMAPVGAAAAQPLQVDSQPLEADSQPLVPALQPAVRWMRQHVAAQVAAVTMLVTVAVVWFFRVGSWAGAVPARPAAAPLPVDALRARLLALAGDAGGATVQQRADGRIAFGFTLADARWLDLSAANRRRRVHRLLLRLDAPARTVWATEQWSQLDAQAGAAGATLRWTSSVGISFFERSVSVEAGLVLGPDGRPTGALLQRERVDLQALKAPCIAAVTGAGWHWRPVMVDWAGLFGRSTGHT